MPAIATRCEEDQKTVRGTVFPTIGLPWKATGSRRSRSRSSSTTTAWAPRSSAGWRWRPGTPRRSSRSRPSRRPSWRSSILASRKGMWNEARRENCCRPTPSSWGASRASARSICTQSSTPSAPTLSGSCTSPGRPPRHWRSWHRAHGAEQGHDLGQRVGHGAKQLGRWINLLGRRIKGRRPPDG